MRKEISRSLELSGDLMLQAHNAEQLVARQLWSLIAAGYRALLSRLSAGNSQTTLAR